MNKDITPLQTQKDIREVNMRVDTFINEVNYHIAKTKEEVQKRNKRRDLGREDTKGEYSNELEKSNEI